jgi:hypothetical protein
MTPRTEHGKIADMARPFIPGLRLAGEFYTEVVRPLLEEAYPGMAYSAALLGWGSDVLGFDGPRSTDHNWGPRLQIFLGAAAGASAGADAGAGPGVGAGAGADAGEITAMLARQLPATFRGYLTVFPDAQDPRATAGHWVQVTSLRSWLTSRIGFDPTRSITLLDWLATPTQRLAEVTAGAVFHDGLGELTQARARLTWYPRDVWLYVLACQWQRIAQEEAFPGRCAEAGDELGSVVVTARLARDLMRLCLLMARRYPPYGKWLGTAFARLPKAAGIASELSGAMSAADGPSRERCLCRAYEAVATLHNELGLTEHVEPRTRPYYERPYQVIGAGRFATALREAIADARVRRLRPSGAVDQLIDSTDALGDLRLLRAVAASVIGPGAADDRATVANDGDGAVIA